MHYVYVCKKKEGADLISKQFYSTVINDLEFQEKIEEECELKEDGKNNEDELSNNEEENCDDEFLSNNQLDDNILDS